MADTEEYFPRGGKKPIVTHFKQSGNFLGAPERGEKKKKKPKKKSEADDGYLSDEAAKDLVLSYKNCAIGLTYKTVKPGVLILGRIRKIQSTKMNIMLPCKMMGSVMACHISEQYNKELEAYVNDQTDKVPELPDMFRPGQYVAVHVLEAKEDQLMLSMMPQHVNGGKKQADLHSGFLIQAAVSSVEDHGYVMDLGIPNTRAFLPKKYVNPEVNLDTGMVTWCTVKSADSSVVTLTGSLSALQRAVSKSCTAPILPATAMDFVVDKPLENGIEGHVMSDTTAYIQRQHADTVKGKKPTLGEKIRARVLYVMPTRNTPFLTMKNIFETTYPDLEEEQKYKEGDIVEAAQVIKVTGRSVHFKLGRDSIGTLSIKRIVVSEDLTDTQVVAQSYPIGSCHRVRILCYHLSDYIYSVSDQPELLDEQYFSVDQLSVGEVVQGTVRTVTDAHVTIAVGRVIGYVPHAHMTDAGVYVDPKRATISKLSKKKFKEGQEITARVLSVDLDKQQVYLTLKPSLLAQDLEVLQSYEQAEVGKAYTGVIKHIRNYILVSFFNNVVALVPAHQVSSEGVEEITQAFHVGQIVNCTILKVDSKEKKMVGSFKIPPFWPNKTSKRKEDSEHKDTHSKKVKHGDDENKQTNKKKKHKTAEEVNEIEDIKKSKKKEKEIEEINSEDNSEVQERKVKSKKRKAIEEPTEISTKKKKGKDNVDSDNVKAEKIVKKESKKKKNKEISDDERKISEESDAIETDIHEEALTPQDLALIDLTDCVTFKNCKKRVLSLLKAIEARTLRLDRVNEKIISIEEKGLDARNKKYHTAMHMEKMVLDERISKLMEALKLTQDKLKDFDADECKDYKKEKKRKKDADNVTVNSEEKKEIEIGKNLKVKAKDIVVVKDVKPVLEVPSAKDFWSNHSEVPSANVQEEESSSSDEEVKEQPKKKRKKLTVAEKVAKARAEEERVREMERKAIESENQPRSSEQFERALLANPDCSQLWIAYMAFHLQATEIEKARAVCRKALNTISFREDQEKLNVWLALLNCEHRFGTKETQQKTLEDALQMNEPFKVHSKLLDILVETGKHQELSSLVDVMMRKYRQDPINYVQCGGACFRAGLVEKARQVMQKALVVLPKKEHVSVLVQFALMERSMGTRERAEALFEQILAVYPQRVDVCSVYVDMLVKGGDVEHVRQVMERITSQKLPARKMKVLYKKWIEVEEKFGDQAQVERIQQKAMEYIDSAKF